MQAAVDPTLVLRRLYDRLPEFMDRLRHRGLTVDPAQEALLFELLARLERVGALAGRQLQDVASLIVPVLAGTPTQQALCHEEFHACMEGHDASPLPQVLASPLASPQVGHLGQLAHRALACGAAKGRIAGVVLAVAVVAAVAAYVLSSHSSPFSILPESSTEASASRNLIVDWIQSYPLPALDLPSQSPRNRTFRWFYIEYDWKKWLALLAPWLLFALVFGTLLLLTVAHLRRESLMQNLRSLSLGFRCGAPRLGDRGMVAELQPLRTLARDAVLELDVIATAKATAAQGGLLSLRYRSRPIPTDFVALVERRSPRDHLAAYAEALLDAMASAGLFIERFEFDRAPWTLERQRTGEVETLHQVLSAFPQAVFLVFVPTEEVADPLTGYVRPWLLQLVATGSTVVFAPEARVGASLCGLAREAGFEILPASPEGLRRLPATLLGARPPPAKIGAVVSGPEGIDTLVDEVEERADRWMQSTPLPSAEVERLLVRLRQVFGREGLRWISATAIYPELWWRMSLFLRDGMGGAAVGRPDTVGADVLGVARLPWFRHGWMPDWLRARMVRHLRSNDRRWARNLLLSALGTANGTAGSGALLELSSREPVTANATNRPRSDRILADYLLPGLSGIEDLLTLPEPLARRIARRPRRWLAICAAVGSLLATGGSVAALAFMPINECDLWGASRFQNDRVGPAWHSDLILHGGFAEQVVAACAAAHKGHPENIRFAFQYARAVSIWPDADEELIGQANRILQILANNGHAAALNTIGAQYREGDDGYPQNDDLALMYFERSANAGSIEALSNMYIVLVDKGDPESLERARLLMEMYYRLGGIDTFAYGRHLLNGTMGFVQNHTKYIEVIKAGETRGDAYSLAEIGRLHERGEYCNSCSVNYELANKYYLKAIQAAPHEYPANKLSHNYWVGNGTQKNLVKAFHYGIMAVRLADLPTRDQLSRIYKIVAEMDEAQLEEVGLDKGALASSLRSSALAGNAADQLHVGLMALSRGDFAEARKWLQKAANQGLQEASDALAEMDQGVPY